MRNSVQKRRVIILIICFLIVIGLGGGFFWWNQGKPAASLLPAAVSKKVDAFTPYFYRGRIPADYHADTDHATYTAGVLMMSLTKVGAPSLTLSEQAMAKTIVEDDLFINGEKVDVNGSAKASVNSVEGRLLGVFLSGDRKTLAFLTTTSDMNKNDLKALLQELVPVDN